MDKYKILKQDQDPLLFVDKRLRGRDASFLLGRSMESLQRWNFILGVWAGLFASLLVILLLVLFNPANFSSRPGFDFLDVRNKQPAPPLSGDHVDKPESSGNLETDKILRQDVLIRKWQETLTHRAEFDPLRRPQLKTPDPGAQASCKARESDRFDCWPEYEGATEQLCQARGCCWNGSPSVNGVPYCFYPDDYVSYAVSRVSKSSLGMTATLVRKTASHFPNNILQLQLDVTYETESRIRFKIFDPENQRFEVPINLTKSGTLPAKTDYNVTLQHNPFGILIQRKSNGAILFDSRRMAPLVFADQFLQIGTCLSSPNIYGLGEHRHSLRLDSKWSRLVLWTRDQPPAGGGNLYGAHPFYLNLEEDGQAHGVFLLNSNAIEVALQPYADGRGALTYHVLGGVLDFYIFTGPSPLAVIEQYVSLIGKPALPPFWSLGFHLCRYGYWNSTAMRAVIERNRALNIPYDVQWNDIDYMHEYLDWTFEDSKNRFQGLRDIVDDLHSHDQRYVIIIDPGISSVQRPGTYPPFDQGEEMDIFVKNASGKILVGKVWPGATAFPDFFHPEAEQYWFNQMQKYHKEIPFDGLWIDMNEPSNFVDGSLDGCTDGPLDNPPFTPPSMNGGKLTSKTVCPSAQHAISSHYNLHNMYGWSETRATSNALKKLRGKRSFVLSRSSFPSSGYYGSHWLGDNRSEWPDLYYSIPGILNLNMFGVPMVGADICGFLEETSRELCIRWMQLGAFYPFMRNHNTLGSKSQDPGAFDTQAVTYMRTALEMRYSLLAYMYTRFYISHTTGSPVVRPLFMLFNHTEMIDHQFMWGSEILVSPVLEEGATTVNAYIPEGQWYDAYNRSSLYMKSGRYMELQAPLSNINLHFRGGSILPIFSTPALTTNALRKQPFTLIVAADEDMAAEGRLYWDDGESLDSVQVQKYTLVEFKMFGSTLKSSVMTGNFPARLSVIELLGIRRKPSTVELNGQAVSYFRYTESDKVLLITEIDVNLQKPFILTWS